MFISCMFYFPRIYRENHLYVCIERKSLNVCGFLFFSYKMKDHKISKFLSPFKHKSNTIISRICNVLFIHQAHIDSC